MTSSDKIIICRPVPSEGKSVMGQVQNKQYVPTSHYLILLFVKPYINWKAEAVLLFNSEFFRSFMKGERNVWGKELLLHFWRIKMKSFVWVGNLDCYPSWKAAGSWSATAPSPGSWTLLNFQSQCNSQSHKQMKCNHQNMQWIQHIFCYKNALTKMNLKSTDPVKPFPWHHISKYILFLNNRLSLLGSTYFLTWSL